MRVSNAQSMNWPSKAGLGDQLGFIGRIHDAGKLRLRFRHRIVLIAPSGLAEGRLRAAEREGKHQESSYGLKGVSGHRKQSGYVSQIFETLRSVSSL